MKKQTKLFNSKALKMTFEQKLIIEAYEQGIEIKPPQKPQKGNGSPNNLDLFREPQTTLF